MDISLANFGDIFGFSAALNIAFVAVDYVHTYSYILSNKVFKFDNNVKRKISDLVSSLIDETSISSIEPVMLNNVSTSGEIEEVKENRKKIEKELKDVENSLIASVNALCESKTNSFISLFLAMYSVLALLLIGVCGQWKVLIEGFWLAMTILTTLIIVIAWIKKNPVCWIINFSSLKHSIFSFFASVFISILISVSIQGIHINSDTSNWLYVFSETLSISNFMVYIFIVKHKSSIINFKISSEIDPLNEKCRNFNDQVNQLMNTSSLSKKIKSKGESCVNGTKIPIGRNSKSDLIQPYKFRKNTPHALGR